MKRWGKRSSMPLHFRVVCFIFALIAVVTLHIAYFRNSIIAAAITLVLALVISVLHIMYPDCEMRSIDLADNCIYYTTRDDVDINHYCDVYRIKSIKSIDISDKDLIVHGKITKLDGSGRKSKEKKCVIQNYDKEVLDLVEMFREW